MDSNNTSNTGLKGAIVLAAALIAGALVYTGYQYSHSGGGAGDLDERIEKGIENYVASQQEAAKKAQEQAVANQPQGVVDASVDDDPVLGDPNAPVTMIVFSDYECPFCKRDFLQVFPRVKEKYIDTGKVKYVYRDFPLNFHDPLSTQQSMAAECVREQSNDEKYFEYHDLIFNTTTSNGRGMEKSQLYDLAEQVGVDRDQFTECLDSEKYKKEVQKDLADGQEYGVQGTPSFFINGRFIGGAYPYETFEKVIEEELSK